VTPVGSQSTCANPGPLAPGRCSLHRWVGETRIFDQAFTIRAG
jgi:hypothetical protein